ncbi:MAG: class I SAM-dependent methyltransferase [Phycisphaerae bacterium]|jgi:2-polyprenyl-3-methyl-5-hydroxy-6-metoxy-1,4-benzoquinol methylase
MSFSAAPEDFRGKYIRTNFITRRLLDGFFNGIADLIKGLDAHQVVELGCGEGHSTARLRGLLPPGAAFEASDVESHLVAAALRQNPGMRIIQESIYDPVRPARSADLVLVLEVLEHLSNPQLAMRQIARLTKHWAVLSVPREPVWRVLNLARGKYVRTWGNTPGHIQHWSERKFVEFVSQFGRVLEIRTPLPWTMVLLEVSHREEEL